MSTQPTREEVLAEAVTNGGFALYDSVYEVVPARQHEQEAAALAYLKRMARWNSPAARQWCEEYGVDFGGGQ